MNTDLMIAFVDELEKDAAAPQLLRRLWQSGLGRAGAGAAVGAGTGALLNPEDRARGALMGAGIGAGAGYGAVLATKAGRQKAKEGLKRFFKAQYHGVTGRGKMPRAPGLKGKELAEAQAAEKAGLTSIPGMVKGLVTKPRATLGEAWRQSGKMGKAMGALDVATGVPRIFDPTTQEGTGEKALGTLGSAGGYFLGGRMPFLGSMLFAAGTGALGKRLGRGIDVVTGHKKPQRDTSAEREFRGEAPAQAAGRVLPPQQAA